MIVLRIPVGSGSGDGPKRPSFLVPISSAFVERCFSQLKFIIEAIGELKLEETLETRVMERMNNYYSRACMCGRVNCVLLMV